jgi:hypothetical protein
MELIRRLRRETGRREPIQIESLPKFLAYLHTDPPNGNIVATPAEELYNIPSNEPGVDSGVRGITYQTTYEVETRSGHKVRYYEPYAADTTTTQITDAERHQLYLRSVLTAQDRLSQFAGHFPDIRTHVSVGDDSIFEEIESTKGLAILKVKSSYGAEK